MKTLARLTMQIAVVVKAFSKTVPCEARRVHVRRGDDRVAGETGRIPAHVIEEEEKDVGPGALVRRGRGHPRHDGHRDQDEKPQRHTDELGPRSHGLVLGGRWSTKASTRGARRPGSSNTKASFRERGSCNQLVSQIGWIRSSPAGL